MKEVTMRECRIRGTTGWLTLALCAASLGLAACARDPEAGGVEAYLREAKIEAGWGWLSMLGYGDFINFVGIAILAGITILCYLAIIPLLLKNKDTIFVVLALLEVLILSVAASGIIQVGH